MQAANEKISGYDPFDQKEIPGITNQLRPNLLYIQSDQHNPFVTGCYGDPLVETPTLDRLAEAGAVFDAAYCCSPINRSSLANLVACEVLAPQTHCQQGRYFE